MPPLSLWARAFALTVALEVPVVVLGVDGRLGAWWRAAAVGVGLQVLTHPALWYLFPRFGPYPLWLTVAELAVAAVESAALAGALRVSGEPWRAALIRGTATAVAANLLSTLVGLALARGQAS